MNTAVVGYGWVGKSMHKLFSDAYIYDINLPNAEKDRVNVADFAFICVPTPLNGNKLDTSIVEEVIGWCDAKVLVIRSTVNPGDSDKWAKKYGKRIVVQPEYLGETVEHPLLNPKERKFLIIGGRPRCRRKLINLYQEVYNANISIRQVSRLEAEVIKLSENRAIAFKVAQCQELYDACEKAKVDYYTVRDAVYGDDPRFNLWWTFVYPNKRGFNSKCIPKDVYAWLGWAETAPITKAILERNESWISQL